jgi:hypothetical protein
VFIVVLLVVDFGLTKQNVTMSSLRA